MLKSFLYNNVRVKLVPYHGQDTHPETGIAFYVNNGNGGVIGVRVYPDGRKVLVNPDFAKPAPGLRRSRKEGYMQFRNAFGHKKCILASHAVYIAWRDKEIPAGMSIDHIDGRTTNNFIRNLRCISLAINSRDGGFLTKLRNKGINPGTSSRQTGGVASAEKGTCIPRWMLLRYFNRMAVVKSSIKRWRYVCLDKEDLEVLLYYANQAAALVLNKKYNLQLNFQPSTGMGSPTQLAKVVMGRAEAQVALTN